MGDIKKIDIFFIFSMLIGVFFLRYIKVMFQLWYIPELLICIYLIINFSKNKNKFRLNTSWSNLWLLFSIIFLLLVLSLNIYKFGFGEIFLKNILMVFSPLTILLYLYYLQSVYKLSDLLKLGRYLLNILNLYFLINVPIIITQYITGTFMMERFLSWGIYDQDHMTGLIGPFGTGILNVFWISLLIGNLLYYIITKNKKWLFIFFAQVPTMIVLSFFNENKSFIPTLIIFLGLIAVYTVTIKKITYKSILKLLIVMVIGLTICTLIYSSIDKVKGQVDKVYTLATEVFYGNPYTSNERAYLNYVAFKKYNAATLGAGINTVDFNKQKIHPNFGINSFSLILIHGGIIYLLAVINLYSTILSFERNEKINKYSIFQYFFYFIIFSFLSIITQPFRDHYIMFMIALLSLFITIYNKHLKYKNNDSI